MYIFQAVILNSVHLYNRPSLVSYLITSQVTKYRVKVAALDMKVNWKQYKRV